MKRKPGKILFPVRSGFPPEAAADILHSFTNKNDILLDPFSESAGLAMEILQTGRRVVAIERNRVSAFFAEIFLRPASLPLLQWAFEDVHAACRETIDSLFATTCPKCGKQGRIDHLEYKHGQTARIAYTCTCSRRRLTKKPDAGDLSAEEETAHRGTSFWHPVLYLPAADASLRYPEDFTSRRTIAALSVLLHAVERVPEASARNVLKAAFLLALPGAGDRRTHPAHEENPWHAFESCFRDVYEAKREGNRLLKDVVIGRSFGEMATGRANALLLSGSNSDPGEESLPEGSVDGVICAAPASPSPGELLRTAIQAAWLGMPQTQPTTAADDEGMASAFHAVRRIGKPGSSVHVYYEAEGASGFHELLNRMEKSRMPVEQIRFQSSAHGRRARCGYILRSQVQKSGAKPPAGIPETSLRRKLADTARTRIRLHGSKTTAGKILHAFYPQLGKAEIASLSKLSIDDLLTHAVRTFAEYQKGRITLRKGKARGKIPAAWRRAVLDAESLSPGGRGDARILRRILLRTLAHEGLTAEDIEAIRADLTVGEAGRNRRTRTAVLLREWGKALGCRVNAPNTSAQSASWKTATRHEIVFSLGKKEIVVAGRRKGARASRWGSLSYVQLEKTLLDWCRSHPEKGRRIAARLIPAEDPSEFEASNPPGAPPTAGEIKLKVIRNLKICDRHFLMTLQLPKGAGADYRAGQFFHILCDPKPDERRPYPLTLRRPLSIHRVHHSGFDPASLEHAADLPEELRSALVRPPARIDFLYRVVGEGTEALSRVRKGTALDAIGPCGNGFTIGGERTAVIVAGGIGIAPLAALAEELRFRGKDVLVYVGAVEKEMLSLAATRAGGAGDGRDLLEVIGAEFRGIGAEILTVCTDDGSLGEKGFVTEMFERGILEGCVPREDVRVYACGPEGMLRAVAGIAARFHLECEMSLEERMACGIGACYSCTVTVRLPDGTNGKQRVCREGPVFQARDILWKD